MQAVFYLDYWVPKKMCDLHECTVDSLLLAATACQKTEPPTQAADQC